MPRPETETLVERALALAEGIERPRILDVGVGSGAIALALKDERPDAQVTGVDVSPDALALARENAERLGLEVELRQRRRGGRCRARAGTSSSRTRPTSRASTTCRRSCDGSPRSRSSAAGEHERLARAADARFVVFEVGDGQADDVAAMLEELGCGGVTITADLTGRARVVEGRLP